MKKSTLFFLITTFIAGSVCSQANSNTGAFTLKGRIVGQDTGNISLHYLNSEGKFFHDTTRINRGLFVFRGIIKEPTVGDLEGNLKSTSVDDPNRTEIFLEPSVMWVTVRVDDFKNAVVEGSKSQAEIEELEKLHKPVYLQISLFSKEYRKIREQIANKATDSLELVANRLLSRMDSCREQLKSIDCDFILTHPDSYVSAYRIGFHLFSLDSLKRLYNALSKRIQQSTDGIKAKKEIDTRESVAVGKIAPEFRQSNVDGMDISLTEFRGKYVLLDFWASWCKPCREENPNLVAAYDRFKTRNFEILGISLDNEKTKQGWLDAIKKYGLVWPQVSDLKGWQNDVAGLYAVLSIPANFLIDTEGKIIAVNLYGAELIKTLEQVLQ